MEYVTEFINYIYGADVSSSLLYRPTHGSYKLHLHTTKLFCYVLTGNVVLPWIVFNGNAAITFTKDY